MCGIAGKINLDKNQSINPEELKRMTDSIIHRGPDDEGHFIDGNVGLGFRRLSIIDLKMGHQPMSNFHENIWITFNGEVYNFLELRKDLEKKGYRFNNRTDTEVIVNLYEEYGENCVDYLRGMFAFIIWDTRKRKVFGARDRFGIKPFYYYIDDRTFVWSSEIKGIKASKGISDEIDIHALDSYFAYGYISGERSIYAKIRKLEPGHCFTIDLDGSRDMLIRRYWDINFEPDTSITEDEWKEMIQEKLKEAVEMRLVSDVPLGAFLSGGIDSSSVVALMSMVSDQPVNTFSIGFKEEKYNETQYARLIAEKYNTNHREMIVEPESIDLLPRLVHAYDEPFADSSAIPTYYVSKFAREYVTVALSGDGGDELFAGYRAFEKMARLNKNGLNNKFTNKVIFKGLNKVIPDHMFGKGYTYYMSKDKHNIGAYFCFWKDYERRKIFNKETRKQVDYNAAEVERLEILSQSNGDFLNKMLELHMKTYMVEDILTKVDRVSMMNSLEVRVPILDHKFAELSFKVPSSFKLNAGEKKYLLKESMRPLLTPEILDHKKQGFGIPLKLWFKDDLKSYIYDTLVGSSSMLSEFLDEKQVKFTVDQHQKGQRDYSSKVWSLLFLNEWMKQNAVKS